MATPNPFTVSSSCVQFFGEEAISGSDAQLVPTAVLQEFVNYDASSTRSIYASRSLEHAIDYLNGKDISMNTRFTAIFQDVIPKSQAKQAVFPEKIIQECTAKLVNNTLSASYAKAILVSASQYVMHGELATDNEFCCKKFFALEDTALWLLPEPIYPLTVIAAAINNTGIGIASMYADAMLNSASKYLISGDKSTATQWNSKAFFALADTTPAIVDIPPISAEEMLLAAKDNTAYGTAGDWADQIIRHALSYVQIGYYNRDEAYNTMTFFQLDDTSAEAINASGVATAEAAEQLGMLGREDGPLSKAEAALHIDGIEEEEVEMVNCCGGDGPCEHPEDEDDDCECSKVACGCVVDNNDTYQCSNCECCEKCCSSNNNCFTCERCENTCSTSEQCSVCNKCESCCKYEGQCWTCSGCGTKYGCDDSNCDACSYCANCCECVSCENCACTHPEGTSICDSCGSCYKSCECTYCRFCGVTEEDRDEDVTFCTKCHRCGNCGHTSKCLFSSKTTKSAAKAINFYDTPPSAYIPKTQKAKGLHAIKERLLGYLTVPPFDLVSAESVEAEKIVGRFVRPCPMVPRHGFVDSRQVVTLEDAVKIKAEALAADPQAEFIVMNRIDAAFSGIWTPGLMVMGPSNDGATAGHGSVTIPVAGEFLNWDIRCGLYLEAGIKQAPYMELLWTRKSPTQYIMQVVQLRDGPPVPQQTDYITKPISVQNIILAEGDLLEWETKMKEPQPSGTVVYHPGGSLASHYAVHAILNNIPVLVSRKPRIGDVLVPTEDGEAQPDLEAIRLGFYYGMTHPTSYRAALYMALLGVHSTALWLGKRDILLGAALGFAYRLTLTACLGEWRHRPNRRQDFSREHIYKRVFDKAPKVHHIYMRALKDFRTLAWSDSMGGERWFQFTQWGAVIHNAVLQGDMKAALAAMNNVVNAAHNNGWGFNKFAENGTLDVVAKDPVQALHKCADIAYEAMTMDRTAMEFRAAKWIASAKPYRIEKFKEWIDKPKIVPDRFNAKQAQVKVLDESTVLVQYKMGVNTAIYGAETVRMNPTVVSQLKDIMLHFLSDGRLMRTFAPNDDGTMPSKYDALKPDELQFIKLTRHNFGRWYVPNPHTLQDNVWVHLDTTPIYQLAAPIPIPASKETL